MIADLNLSNPEWKMYLTWFIEHTLDNYLDQNTESVISAIKKDNPPIEIKKILLEFEKSHKNRGEIIKCLMV